MKEGRQHAVFTVCNLHYLPKALALAESVMKHDASRLIVVLCDQKSPLDVSKLGATILWVEDLGIPHLYELAFKYDIIEFSTSIKPFVASRLLEEHEKVIFLDPDTCIYRPLTPILGDLDQHWVVLTPHYTTPQSDDSTESDLGMMRFGSFNLGFFAVRRSDQARRFLDWWWRRCLKFSFMESQFGLSVDQKWVSIAPALFPGMYISFHLGYNVAPWNTFERELSVDAAGQWWVNTSVPLIFFHFSNFDPTDPEYLNKRSITEKNRRRPHLGRLSMEYQERIRALTVPEASRPYGFDYMSGGEYISPALRRAYASIVAELPQSHAPFDSDGIVGGFARVNHLLERRPGRYKAVGFRDIRKYRAPLKAINIFMRALLRVLGPNRFQNLSSLLVYLSSYRQNRGLWKYDN